MAATVAPAGTLTDRATTKRSFEVIESSAIDEIIMACIACIPLIFAARFAIGLVIGKRGVE